MPNRVYTELESRRLEKAWALQVKRGVFSAGVMGVGEFRYFGKAGDAPATYPRIMSLDVLSELTEAEQYALMRVEQAAHVAQQQGSTLVSVRPGQRLDPRDRLEVFDPTQPSIFAVAKVVGG